MVSRSFDRDDESAVVRLAYVGPPQLEQTGDHGFQVEPRDGQYLVDGLRVERVRAVNGSEYGAGHRRDRVGVSADACRETQAVEGVIAVPVGDDERCDDRLLREDGRTDQVDDEVGKGVLAEVGARTQ